MNLSRCVTEFGAQGLELDGVLLVLTRGRDGAVIFVPPVAELDATAARLQGHGVKAL